MELLSAGSLAPDMALAISTASAPSAKRCKHTMPAQVSRRSTRHPMCDGSGHAACVRANMHTRNPINCTGVPIPVCRPVSAGGTATGTCKLLPAAPCSSG